MTDYIIEIQEADDGDLFIVFPDDLMDTLGWKEGDVLDWRLKGDGVVLKKLNDASGCSSVD